MTAAITALGYHLPDRVVTNAELAAENPAWDFQQIETRSGVLERRVAAPNETALDLAAAACTRLFDRRPGLREGVDAIIFVTESPDYVMPPNACLLQHRLGVGEDCLAFDVNLGCSGFVYGLTVAEGLIAARRATQVLLVTAETYSRHIHPGDRAVRTLFGDGAAVALIEPAGDGAGLPLIDSVHSTQGRHFNKFYIPAGGARRPRGPDTAEPEVDRSGNLRSLENIHMDGFGVLSVVKTEVPRLMSKLLTRHGLSAADIDLFVCHQGSRLALEAIQKLLRAPPERIFSNIARIGNTVSASVPIALADAWAAGLVRPGSRIVLCAFGLGFSNAIALLGVDPKADLA